MNTVKILNSPSMKYWVKVKNAKFSKGISNCTEWPAWHKRLGKNKYHNFYEKSIKHFTEHLHFTSQHTTDDILDEANMACDSSYLELAPYTEWLDVFCVLLITALQLYLCSCELHALSRFLSNSLTDPKAGTKVGKLFQLWVILFQNEYSHPLTFMGVRGQRPLQIRKTCE